VLADRSVLTTGSARPRPLHSSVGRESTRQRHGHRRRQAGGAAHMKCTARLSASSSPRAAVSRTWPSGRVEGLVSCNGT